MLSGQRVRASEPVADEDSLVIRTTVLPTRLACPSCEIELRDHGEIYFAGLGDYFEVTKNLTGPEFEPDIVYDIYATAPDVERNGYETVLTNLGIDPGVTLRFGPFFYRRDISMYQYAAVRAELAGRLGLSPKSFDWKAVLMGKPGTTQ